MKLYFTPKEFRVTDTGLPNFVTDDNVHFHLVRLKYTLNTLRGILGCPIIVNSAYRSPEVNSAVGGSKTSYHLFGRAADITCKSMPKLLELCMQLHESGIFVECIYYPDKNYIHVAI